MIIDMAVMYLILWFPCYALVCCSRAFVQGIYLDGSRMTAKDMSRVSVLMVAAAGNLTFLLGWMAR